MYNLYYFFLLFVFISCVFVFSIMHMKCICLVSDVCIRLWAVIVAQLEPYCPARCELIFVTAVVYCWAK